MRWNMHTMETLFLIPNRYKFGASDIVENIFGYRQNQFTKLNINILSTQ